MSGPDGSEPAYKPVCQGHPRTFKVGDSIGIITGIETPDPKETRIAFLETARPKLIDYLKMKLEAEDWHGCQDAASDLRDVDCELQGLRY